ncbi:MAG: adenylate cyclase [Actinomycetota bacterium]|nr:adenylate cyclase [Actinomycetota bacterium]
MGLVPDDPRLSLMADELNALQWSALLLDADFNVVCVTEELKEFVGVFDEKALGYGQHVVTAFLRDEWRDTLATDSQIAIFTQLMPMFLDRVPGGIETFAAELPSPFDELVASLEPQPLVSALRGRFDYLQPGIPPYPVDFLGFPVSAPEGEMYGYLIIMYIALRPTLVSLLARGDAAMYERMADLVNPERHQAAILFADLEASGSLSRRLPSAAYFALMRDLHTEVDRIVAENLGVIGKPSRDGATAFFLVDHLSDASSAARAAVAAARSMQQCAEKLLSAIPEAAVGGLNLNIGLHWGGALYMGQLVPGGRLDVSALGDEVNECARVEDTAFGGEILATKALVEQLNDGDALAAGVDCDNLVYEPLRDRPHATEKAIRDAGGVAVTSL